VTTNLPSVLLISVLSMAGITDIPDWTDNEAGLSYDWANPSSLSYETMFSMSPIRHIDNVKAPVFLMIGGEL
jgi:dipeptidyl aminopeptidase/acylaminoacyl peptidase